MPGMRSLKDPLIKEIAPFNFFLLCILWRQIGLKIPKVLIIFGVLLIRREEDHSIGPFPTTQRTVLGLLLAIVVAGLMVLVALQFNWSTTIPSGNYEQAQDITFLAEVVWGRYILLVELLALALLTAMVGGISLLRMEKQENLAAYRTGTTSTAADHSPVDIPGFSQELNVIGGQIVGWLNSRVSSCAW